MRHRGGAGWRGGGARRGDARWLASVRVRGVRVFVLRILNRKAQYRCDSRQLLEPLPRNVHARKYPNLSTVVFGGCKASEKSKLAATDCTTPIMEIKYHGG